MIFSLSLIFALSGLDIVKSAPINNNGHHHHREALDKRGSTCAFPSYDGMVAVQTSGQNAGWAMSSDQTCSPGTWCPYACKPGQLMGQWDPSVTSYTYPGSMNGGLYCDSNGNLQKPNSDKDYCYDGAGTLSAQNNAGDNIAFCQTVLPGNEAMLIPTDVSSGSSQPLAVPGPDYFASTSSHFYVNPPGVSVDDGCTWGSDSNPWGNWSPYVVGANQDSSGKTYVKIGWNPIYLDSSLKNTKPSFGIKVTCDDESKCNNLPCSIDPSENDINEVTSSESTGGSGGSYCVVTVQSGASAKIEVFNA